MAPRKAAWWDATKAPQRVANWATLLAARTEIPMVETKDFCSAEW